jgi:hypothetical protein
VKERPINFSASMVKALLAGTKTQTRRIMRPQPIPEISEIEEVPATDPYLGCVVSGHSGIWEDVHSCDLRWKCPFGMPGDRLWVREDHHITLIDQRAVSVRYMADDEFTREITIGPREFEMFQGRKRPLATTRGRFMWRCLSRITLEIVSVRVERLNAITEADAKAEGVFEGINHWRATEDGEDVYSFAYGAYSGLWETINGGGSWALNPWVFVIDFRRVE